MTHYKTYHQNGRRVTVIVFSDGTVVVVIEPIEPIFFRNRGGPKGFAPFLCREYHAFNFLNNQKGRRIGPLGYRQLRIRIRF